MDKSHRNSVNTSRQDLDVTKRLVEVGKLVGIEVMDHVIIGDRHLSFKEKGLI
jgi:DNA repair protein RadC